MQDFKVFEISRAQHPIMMYFVKLLHLLKFSKLYILKGTASLVWYYFLFGWRLKQKCCLHDRQWNEGILNKLKKATSFAL